MGYSWDYSSGNPSYTLGDGKDTQLTYEWSPETKSAATMKIGTDSGSSAGAGGSMGPAALMVGGSFLTNMMAQRAAEEENKKKMLTELALKQGDNESNYMKQLMDVYRQSLLGGK